jgi:hypothetical protein
MLVVPRSRIVDQTIRDVLDLDGSTYSSAGVRDVPLWFRDRPANAVMAIRKQQMTAEAASYVSFASKYF